MRFDRLAGGALAFALASSVALAQELIGELGGVNGGDAFGSCVAAGGDVDGDGVGDLLMTTKMLDATGAVVWGVELRSGADRSLLRTHAGTAGVFFGAATLFVADADADGVTDYLVMSFEPTSGTRSATLFSGAAGTWLRDYSLTASTSDYVHLLRAIGDLDGDGTADFVTSTSGAAGGVVDVVSTQSGAVLFTLSDSRPQYAGDLAVVADRDGDAFEDLAICDELNGDGVVWLHSGVSGAKLDQYYGQRGDGFADSVTRVADLDGDGNDELLVGAFRASGAVVPRCGAVYAYSGASHKVLFRLEGEQRGSGFGRFVADAGDVNGDGVHDVAVGAPFVFGGGYFGPAFLFSGKTLGPLYRFDFPATMTWSVHGIVATGDLDGDGFDDLAVGDPESDLMPPGAGRVRLYGGNDVYLLTTPRSAFAGDVVTLATREGTTAQLVLLAMVDVGGSPLFQTLALGHFDSTGAFLLADSVPPGLSGLAITFQSFAQKSHRGLRVSAPEVLTFP